MRALSIASTGMLAQQTNVEVIANNLANMNTTGFKEQRAEFQDLLYQNVLAPGAQTSDQGTYAPNGIQIGAGRQDGGDLTASPPRAICPAPPIPMTWRSKAPVISACSRRTAPMAIPGRAISRSRPRASWVTQDGMLVQPGIAIPANTLSVSINAQGQVTATVAGNSTPQTVGQLELTRFPNEAGLNAIGGNILLETPASGSPQSGVPGSAGYGTIQQGFLETANVNSVNEITSLITAQRAYEMNSKVITAADQMLQQTSQMAQG